MAVSHAENKKLKLLRLGVRIMLLGGLIALAYVILQSFSSPKSSLERFTGGSLSKLIVLEPAPPQPSRAFTGPDGSEIRLSDFKGQSILVNLWAIWCAPCVAEIPSLDALQSEKGGADFMVVPISIDRARIDAEQFLADKNVENLSLFHDKTLSLPSDFDAPGLPITVFYGPDGIERFRISGEVNWQSAEAQALLRAALP